ncbi:hypothetical protein RMN56_22075 [Micromonospora halotolerans]|uniref:Polymorphic outer membrane protein repeat-containing protein n=1 Tax=Micromonospora halotolerans TaxID=709879 RepID=A0ABY9ZS42_9ACTN|nr:hypothetical protein [Micromonospora halotolerans]WNM37825.1 hypothetical protein RMN56_22075 [Micromonospora halotolerans]
MSNDVTNSDGGAPMTPSTNRRRALLVATGVAGLTGVVGLAALGGLAARDNDKSGTPNRVAENRAAAPQHASDADKGDHEDGKDGKDGDKGRSDEGRDRGEWDADGGDHGKVREVPCDDDELVEALDLANRDHGGTLKLAEDCTYELGEKDRKFGAALPEIKQDITIKGNGSTIKRDAEDTFRIFRVVDGGDLTLKDLTVKGGNATAFKYGGGGPQIPGGPGNGGPMAPAVMGAAPVQAAPVAVGSGSQGSGSQGSGSQGSGSQGSGSQGSDSRDGDKRDEKKGEGDGGALLVERGGSAHLVKVKLTDNNAEENGGAIANFGRVHLEDSKVENNHARQDGGGIFNRGVLKVEESHIDDNTAGGNGGGIANGNGRNDKNNHDPHNYGQNNNGQNNYGQNSYDSNSYDRNKDKDFKHDDEAGTVEIVGSAKGKDSVQSTLSDNKAGKNGGGLFSSGGFVTITFTAITGNTACENGGGIYAENTALKLDKVLVAKNHADGNGGGIVNTGGKDKEKEKDWSSNGGDSKERDNRERDNKESDATATISDSTIVDNTANRFGGGIFNGEWLVKVEDGFTERRDQKDDNATLTLRDTEIKNNTALNGGGIFNNKGKVTLTKTHVTKNTATDTAKLHRVAGGILNNEGKVKLDDKSTVTNNDPTNCANTVEDCFN